MNKLTSNRPLAAFMLLTFCVSVGHKLQDVLSASLNNEIRKQLNA